MTNLIYQVVIPQFKDRYQFSAKRKIKYYKWEEKDKLPLKYLKVCQPTPKVINKIAYVVDVDGNRFIKNTKTAGTPNEWILNTQDLYNAKLDWRKRRAVATFFHNYYTEFINQQLVDNIEIPEGKFLSISCDIYEIKRTPMPDITNLWLITKFFEDALVGAGKIPDDSPEYVMESGRHKYHWVATKEERKLIFTIKVI
jgi:hypothetical protein